MMAAPRVTAPDAATPRTSMPSGVIRSTAAMGLRVAHNRTPVLWTDWRWPVDRRHPAGGRPARRRGRTARDRGRTAPGRGRRAVDRGCLENPHVAIRSSVAPLHVVVWGLTCPGRPTYRIRVALTPDDPRSARSTRPGCRVIGPTEDRRWNDPTDGPAAARHPIRDRGTANRTEPKLNDDVPSGTRDGAAGNGPPSGPPEPLEIPRTREWRRRTTWPRLARLFP